MKLCSLWNEIYSTDENYPLVIIFDRKISSWGKIYGNFLIYFKWKTKIGIDRLMV